MKKKFFSVYIVPTELLKEGSMIDLMADGLNMDSSVIGATQIIAKTLEEALLKVDSASD